MRSRAGRWVSLHALSAAIVAGGTVGALARFALDETIPVLDGLDGTILGERRRARFFSRNEGVPALVVSVGPRARLPEILPRLRALAGRHVVTVERVRVVRRMWHRVMVFCGEPARWEGHPMYTRLIRRLREAEAAGATALRGTVGYSDDGPRHGDRFLALRRRTPVIVTMIDTVNEIARLRPIVARATAESGLVTVEVVPAFHAIGPGLSVGGLRLADPPVSGSGGSPGRPTR